MRGHQVAFATVIALVLGWQVAHAAVTVSPSTIATPEVAVGVESAAATGTMTTTTNGNNKVDIIIGTCTGAGAGMFAISPANTIMFMDTVTLSVTYTPSALGMLSCSVSVFPMGQTTGALGTFTVTGDAQRPPTIVAGSISAFPAVRVFDNAVAASTSTRTLTMSNSGDRTLNISSVSLSGDFSIDPSSPSGLGATTIAGANGTRNWIIRFNPSAIGTRTGSITFNSNDPSTPVRVVNLTGDGTSGAFTISQGAGGNFGTVASGTSATLDIGVQHSGANPRGTLTFNSATITAATQAWFTVNGQPSSLDATTTTSNVTIQCAPPAGATATATATVNIIADSDGSPGSSFRTTLTQNISCQGGASVLALSAPMVDFNPQLVGTMSTAQTVTITNAGTSNASVSFTPNGANAGRFTAIGPAGCGGGTACTIPMNNGSIDVTVRFAPNAEGTVGASFQLTGAGPSVGFSVSGRGIDRHINLPDTMQVEDTFRNPGSRATRSGVPILNTGEYPIVISGLDMGGNTAVWSVDEETLAMLPITVPGLATVELLVRFTPTEAGKAEDGQLLITNDDLKIAAGMPIVVLAGNGKDRNVDMSPGAIDVGETFAGVPTRLSIARPEDMLTVINMEVPDGTKNDFTIREIKVEGDDAAMFVVQDLDGQSLDGRALTAGESVRVDVVFNPSQVGEFEATLVLYLDEDPTYVRLIPVRGRALFADAHGSGGFGCSTGSGSHGAMVLLVAVLGLVLRRRRR